jgi:hypothetical protein
MRWGWREIAVAAAVVLSAAVPTTLAVFAINLANSDQMAVELEQNGKATAYANRANINKESRCGPLAEKARADCEAQEDEAVSQAQHDEYDLAAQKATAIWTRYMGAAAILGTAFGIFGIVLVLLTFWENKRAADAAHDANRPWVEGEPPKNVQMELTAEGIKLEADVGLVNHGNSPATHVLVQARLALKPTSDTTSKTIPISRIEAALDEWEAKHSHRGKIVYPNKPETGIFIANLPIAQIRAEEGDPPRNCHYLLAVGISYRFGDKRGRTVRAYVLMNATGHGIIAAPYTIGKNVVGKVGGNQISLADTLEGYAT